jgi:hypothetical protein
MNVTKNYVKTIKQQYDSYIQNFGKKPGRHTLSEITGISTQQARYFLFIFENWDVFNPEKSTGTIREYDNNNIELSIIHNEPMTEARAFDVFGLDPKKYYVDKFEANAYPTSMKLKNGDTERPVQVLNYQTKLQLKPNKREISLNKWIDVFNNSIDPPESFPKPIAKTGELLFELSIADLHLGKLAWENETGENYDLRIAEKRFNYIVDSLLAKALKYGFEKIVFLIGNDFFHSDSLLENRTNKGTQLDVDSRGKKAYKIGFKMVVNNVTKLQQYAPVDIVMIPGNHDKEKLWYFGHSIKSYFRNNDRVKVDNSEKSHKVMLYGNNLTLFTHGEEKNERLRTIMTVDFRELYGKTLFHEIHKAHMHRLKSEKYKYEDEDNGITIRTLRSPTGTDLYHYEKGFIGQVKGGCGYLYDKNFGLEHQFYGNYLVER